MQVKAFDMEKLMTCSSTYCKVLQLLPSAQNTSNFAKCKVKVDIKITPRLKPQHHAQMSRKYVQDPSFI